MKVIPKALIVAGILLIAAQAYAKDNYCGECHTAKEIAAFGNVMAWDRSVYQAKGSLCPGFFELKKEAYFSESRLVKFNEFLTELDEKARKYPEYMREDLDADAVQYAELATITPTSINGLADPNLKIKKKMNDVYQTINKLWDDHKMEKVMGFGLFGVMLISLLFFLGLKNTLKG